MLIETDPAGAAEHVYFYDFLACGIYSEIVVSYLQTMHKTVRTLKFTDLGTDKKSLGRF